MAEINQMLDRECREEIYRVLIGNKADLTYKRRMLATEGATIALENGMHQYFEFTTKSGRQVRSIITEVINVVQQSKKLESQAS